MRFFTLCLLALFPLLTWSPPQQPNTPPPPLAIASYENNETTYYLYDFKTGETTSVTRTRPDTQRNGMFYGYVVPPTVIPFYSPYDLTLRFVMVDESDPATDDVENGYSLYRLDANKPREFIAAHVWTGENPYWSPDGRYLYISPYSEEDEAPILYFYDIMSHRLLALTDNAGRIQSCDSTNVWCVYSQTTRVNKSTVYTLYLLDKKTGRIAIIDHADDDLILTYWRQGRPELLYVKPDHDEQTVHLYDYETETEQTLTQVATSRISEAELSPDNRWLALRIDNADQSGTDIILVDLQAPDQPVKSLSSAGDAGYVEQFSMQWVGDYGLLYALGNKDQSGIYLLQPGKKPRQLLSLDGGYVYDYALSPDGDWLAVLEAGVSNPKPLLAIPLGGGDVVNVPAPDALEDMDCIGWVSEAESKSGTAFLCDKFWGEG